MSAMRWGEVCLKMTMEERRRQGLERLLSMMGSVAEGSGEISKR